MLREIQSVVFFFLGITTHVWCAQTQPKCEQWNSRDFFRTATVENVTACIDAGSDVVARTDKGYTPLHWASGRNSNPAVIEVLVASGADLRARDNFGDTPLHWAARYNEDPAPVQTLLTAGADLSAGDRSGRTPLHLVAKYTDNPEVIQTLLEAGADFDARDDNGRKPLYYAAQRDEDSAAFARLLAAGATLDVRDRDNNGQTLLHMAASSENVVVIKLLLAAGADPNARDNDGATPLHEAAGYSGWSVNPLDRHRHPVPGSTAVVGLLLAAGANPEVRSNSNSTPLHWAAYFSQNPAVPEMLLAAGANPEARDKFDRTPLSIASTRLPIDFREVLQAPPRARPAATEVEDVEMFRDCPAYPQMVVIPAGQFRMGCVSGSRACESDEWPVHEVKVASFALGRYEVTFEEYDCFAKATDRRLPDDEGWGRGRRPVINVSWQDAVAYAQWLSAETEKPYRLPSEAEWEYAARAGTVTRYSWGPYVGRNRASCDDCRSQWDDEATTPVGSFNPNGWGLHNVHGNVSEWVQDCWNENYQGAPTDGSAWETGECSQRVLRGGARGLSKHLRSASRYGASAGLRLLHNGFRVARTITP